MELDNSKYFCEVGPDDDNIDFWSNHFNEFVLRGITTGEINREYGERFLATQKGYHTEVLTSTDGFKRKGESIHLMH